MGILTDKKISKEVNNLEGQISNNLWNGELSDSLLHDLKARLESLQSKCHHKKEIFFFTKDNQGVPYTKCICAICHKPLN